MPAWNPIAVLVWIIVLLIALIVVFKLLAHL